MHFKLSLTHFHSVEQVVPFKSIVSYTYNQYNLMYVCPDY